MPPQAIVRDAARDDLLEQARFIAEDDLDAALRFLDAARAEFDRLALMPHLGRRREFRSAHLQEVRSRPVRGFEKILVFYRPVPSGIDVLRVLHGARDLGAIFHD